MTTSDGFPVGDHFGELLSALLDGEVTPEEAAATEAHLATCPDCRAERDRLLLCPASSEGLEESPNVVYLGGAPNQTLIPLVRWAYANQRKRHFFLVGSEYVYSHVVNAILEHELTDLGAAVVGTRY